MAMMVFLVVLLPVLLVNGCTQDKDMAVDCSDIYESGQTVSGIYSIYPAGLENMCQLTSNRKYMLRVDLEDFTGRKGFALYSTFSVDCETDGYTLHISGFKDGGAGDSLFVHNGQKFSTFDKDQDTININCAKRHVGAFWYRNCVYTNPNGVYLWGEDPTIDGIGNFWFTWKNNYVVGLKSISMKIRRVS